MGRKNRVSKDEHILNSLCDVVECNYRKIVLSLTKAITDTNTVDDAFITEVTEFIFRQVAEAKEFRNKLK